MKKITASSLLSTFVAVSTVALANISFGTTLSTAPAVLSNEGVDANESFAPHTIYLTPSVNITPGYVITFELPNVRSTNFVIYYKDKNGNEKRACGQEGISYRINNTAIVKFTDCNLEAGKTYYFNMYTVFPVRRPIMATLQSYTYTINYRSNVPGDTSSSAVIAYTQPQFGFSVDKISYKDHYAKITLSREDFARIYHYDLDTGGEFDIEMKDLPTSISKYVIITTQTSTPRSGTVKNGKFVGDFSSQYPDDPAMQKIYVYLYYRGQVEPLNNAKLSLWLFAIHTDRRIYYFKDVPLSTATRYRITPPSGLSLIKTSTSNMNNANQSSQQNNDTSMSSQINNTSMSPLDKLQNVINNVGNTIQSGKSAIDTLKSLFR